MKFLKLGWLRWLRYTLLLLGAANAAMYRLPIYEQYHTISEDSPRRYRLDPSQQRILSEHGRNDHPKSDSLKDIAIILYGVNASMGTPPQSFIMAIDIEWDALFVPSSDCYSQFCDSNDISMFNATNSSTYYGGHESMTFNYAGMNFDGAISKDTLSFNGLEIKIQPFVEATDIWPGSFFNWYFGYSGVIGFAPGFDPHREQQVESPWQMLVKTHDLDENVFSIKLPRGIRHLDKPRSDGELTIGGLDPAYSDLDFIHLPLAEENLTSWSVKVQSLTWGDGRSLHQDFSNCMARFYTSIPYILLPQLWADQLLDLIGAMQPKGMFMAFPCENRETLPDLTFLLAGETIALTSFEYSFEMTFGESGGEEPSCVVGFDDAEEDTMVLGWPFLQNFISVFDQDAREVRLARITSDSEKYHDL